MSYYRIREVSFNGKESFSAIRTVIFDKDKTVFTIFPNPKIQVSPLSIHTNWTEQYTFNIFDATGKRVYTRTCKGNIELDNVDLPSGFYLYECATTQDKVTGKLVVP